MKNNVLHWWLQRITAVSIIPLFFFIILTLGSDFDLGYIKSHYIIILLFLAITLYHSILGVQVICDDYIHNKKLKKITLLIVKITYIVTLIIGFISVIYLYV